MGYSLWGSKEPDMTEHVCVHTHTHTNLCVLERDNDCGKNKGGIRNFGRIGGGQDSNFKSNVQGMLQWKGDI